MTGGLALWVVIVAVGALTYLSRLSFIALFARWEMPALVSRALRFVPAAMLTGIVVPAVVLGGSGADPALAREKLAAALLAALVAWRTRSPAATMVAGMAALWLMQWLLRAVAA
jgi:branched-subunit amino acid transport protein